MKKIFALFFTFIFLISTSAQAFSFKKKKADPLDYSQKLGYVNMNFWNRFEDPYLGEYIEAAVRNNHDARKASWQVEEYRQNVKYSFGQELPSMKVMANYTGVHIPRLDNFQLNQNAFILPFVVNYEPDFLLKNRDKTKSTKKAYESQIYAEKSIYLSLASDVATTYVNILQYDQLVAYQKHIVKIKETQLDRTVQKFSRGVVNNETLNKSKQDMDDAINTLEIMEQNRQTALTQLAVLIGASPECAKDLKRSTLGRFEYNFRLPSIFSSDVVFSRPDVLSNEAMLEKAKIDVRVARKEFLPSFNITGIWAFNTFAPGTFFSWESSVAAIIAGASQDIFKGGMKVANLRVKKAYYEQMFEAYRKSVEVSLKEINDSLYIIKSDTQIDKNTVEQFNLQKSTYVDYQKKLKHGVISYPDLLTQQEKLLNIAQNHVQTKTTRIVNYFTLYKAVGGCL